MNADERAVAEIAHEAFVNQPLTSRSWSEHVAAAILASDWLTMRDRKAMMIGWNAGWDAHEAFVACEPAPSADDEAACAAALLRTMEILRSTNPSPAVLETIMQIESEAHDRKAASEGAFWDAVYRANVPPCHCGDRVAFGFDGNPEHHRGMCAHCDAARCDAYPGECGRP